MVLGSRGFASIVGSEATTWGEVASGSSAGPAVTGGGEATVDEIALVVSGSETVEETVGGGSESSGWLVVEIIEELVEMAVVGGPTVVSVGLAGTGGIGTMEVAVVVGIVDSVVLGHVVPTVVGASVDVLDSGRLSVVLGASLEVLGASDVSGG